MPSTYESSGEVLVILRLPPEVVDRVEKSRQLLEAKDVEEVFRIGYRFLEWYLLLRQAGESLFRGKVVSDKKIVGRFVSLDNL